MYLCAAAALLTDVPAPLRGICVSFPDLDETSCEPSLQRYAQYVSRNLFHAFCFTHGCAGDGLAMIVQDTAVLNDTTRQRILMRFPDTPHAPTAAAMGSSNAATISSSNAATTSPFPG
jgi:hypothetical protein